MLITDLDKFKAKPVDPGYSPTSRCFYAPVDNVHGAIGAVLAAAQHSIVVAVYGFDDDEFAATLDAALKDPTMFVQISLDRSQAGGVHEKAILAKYASEMTGNSVAIGNSERGAIMHRKMVIVDGAWLIGGSTNWSDSGETLQANEMRVMRDPIACAEARALMDITHNDMLRQMAARAAKAA